MIALAKRVEATSGVFDKPAVADLKFAKIASSGRYRSRNPPGSAFSPYLMELMAFAERVETARVKFAKRRNVLRALVVVQPQTPQIVTEPS